ncbi:MAG: hypothetical protein RDV41_14465, partial [Planctomycetota bacterium]|nr:hypothetical protein [Planctomycetota bacterium]
MKKRIRGLSLLLLAISALWPIAASYADVKDDIDFALGLAKRKYFDMAREVRDSIEKNPAATVAEKAELQMVSAQILRLEAEADPDPEKREKLLEDAIGQLEKFIAGAQGSVQRITEARFTVGDLLTQRGRILTDRYQRETDPTQKAKFRQDAETRFKKAEDYFQKMIEYYEKLADEQGVAINDDVNLMEARRLLPTCKYFHSLLYGRGTPEQKKLLSEDPQVFPKGAVALFVEFIESYEGSLSAYEVSIYLGLCFLELGKLEESDIWFDHVTELKEEIEGVAEQHREMIWDVVFRAYYLKAKGLRGNGKHAAAVDTVNKMLATKKGAEKYDIVLAAMMEMAESLLVLRQADKAVETAMKVAASNSPVKNMAIEFVSKNSGGVEISPKGLLEMMRNSRAKKEYSKVIRQGRALLAVVARDNVEFVPEAYMAMGDSYFRLGRFHEAAFAFARVYEDFPTYADASKAAYGAVGAWNEISGITKNADDKRTYLDAVKVLDSKYGSTPEAKNAPYLMGRADELEGKFLDAAKNFERVPKEAGMYEEAFARLGYCFFKHASATYEASKKEKDETKKKTLADEALKTL